MGSAKVAVMSLFVLPSFFFLSSRFLPCAPSAGLMPLHLLPYVRVASSVLLVFVPLHSARILFFFAAFLSNLFLLHILQNTCRSFCFLFLFAFVLFSFCFRFLFIFFRLFVFVFDVLVPGTLAFHFLYVGELRPIGVLCLTVCDHIICISLG